MIDRILNAPGIHFLATRGPIKSLKARAFDARIRARWNGRDYKGDPELIGLINEKTNGGHVLMMGCGTGEGLELIKAKHIQAVDLSPEAVKLCQHRMTRNPHAGSCSAQVGDMEEYFDSRQYDLICFLESIYYVPQARQAPLLDRLRLTMMNPGALFMSTFNQVKRYSGMIEGLKARGSESTRTLKSGEFLVIHR